MGLVLAIAFAVLGSAGAILGATGVLVARAHAKRLIPSLLAFATGTLLSSALLGLLPGALERRAGIDVYATVLGGIVGFYILEMLVLWRHEHGRAPALDPGESVGAAGPIILIGDFFHNLVDGVVIGTAFAADTGLGISVSLAIFAHEVPQEVGDFAILLESGYSRTRALMFNLLSSSSTLPASVISYLAAGSVEDAVPFMLAIAAASFLYIGLADMVPLMHKHRSVKRVPVELGPMLMGIATIAAIKAITG